VRGDPDVDPELRTAARFLPPGYALHRGLTLSRAVMKVGARVGRLSDVPEQAVNDTVSVRLHRPVDAEVPGPALLWIHGGAGLMGSAAQEDKFCRALSNATGVSIAAVNHRVAPEHPFPAPVDDCYAALHWLTEQEWADSGRIGIGGSSAGGGFAAKLTQLARDRGDVTIAMQMMLYPMLDDRTGAHGDDRTRIMWSARDNQLAWRWYLGGVDPDLAAPARCEDLSGLPPAWIGVGSLDLFCDESLAYAGRLQDAGVPTRLEVATGGYHAFDLIVPKAAVSQRFFASQCDFVCQSLRTRS
jgi:acetyl esterase/lipase